MKTITVTSKQDLLPHRSAIEALFFDCFGERDVSAVWTWAYLDNPNGEPIVSLCYDGDRLVGHYAIVPMPLSSGALKCSSYLSMTTMVAASHRRFGLFTQLAQLSYASASEQAVDCVFGFPNAQSTPGFRSRLQWTLPAADYVASLDKPHLLAFAKNGGMRKAGRLGLDLTDRRLREWRLARPGASYSFADGLAYKAHRGTLDLLWWDEPEALQALPEGTAVNLLVQAASGLEAKRQFDYQFGGIGLRASFDASRFNREMAMSDLF